jgi:type II restriction/modification system DNA methylase subunit YeeA
LTAKEFIAKWQASTLKERSAAQEHFIDLCRLLEHKTPAEADPTGEHFTFERGAAKTGGGDGWADVWKKGCFAWEYKGKHKDLTAAFSQLQRYAIALENPPLLVVSDMETIIIHTNYTNTVQEIHTLALEDLERPEALQKLRRLLTEPERFRPGVTRQMVTEQAAQTFAGLAQTLRNAGHENHRVAHFVNKLIFCMFAEDSGILPGQLFTRMVESIQSRPEKFAEKASLLFAAMRDGGEIGFGDIVPWFNGGLFNDADALPLDSNGPAQLLACAKLDWSEIEPAIFGTLFERGLEDRPRYTPTTTFETFPFPTGLTPNIPAADYADNPQAQAIAAAARQLVELRDNWLNPAEWVERVPEVVAGYPDRILPKPGCEKDLAKRTLTNLYNQRPQWLANAHAALDATVAAAYEWPAALADDEVLSRLLALNLERSGGKPT